MSVLLEWVCDAHLRQSITDQPTHPSEKFCAPEFLQDKILKVGFDSVVVAYIYLFAYGNNFGKYLYLPKGVILCSGAVIYIKVLSLHWLRPATPSQKVYPSVIGLVLTWAGLQEQNFQV